jgi:hypothetical protein
MHFASDSVQLQILLKAVENLYYNAHWTSDRLSEEEEKQIWLDIKEAANFTNKDPKPL